MDWNNFDQIFLKANFIRGSLLYFLVSLLFFNLALLVLFISGHRSNPRLKSIYQHYFPSKKLIIILNVVFGLFLSASLAGLLLVTPKVTSPTSPSLGTTELSNAKPLIIEFDRPLDRTNLKYKILPEIKGRWTYQNKIFCPSRLIFTPEETAQVETRYTVTLDGLKSILGQTQENYLFSFQTAPAPKVVSVNPKNGDKDIKPNQVINVNLDFSPKGIADFTFELNPPIKLAIENNDQQFFLKPQELLKKGLKYNLKIFRTKIAINFTTNEKRILSEKEEVWSGEFLTIPVPGVKSYSPSGSGILTNSSVKVEFLQKMDQSSVEQAFGINPTTLGIFSWEGNRILTFKPDTLNKNTRYTVSIKKTALTADSNQFEQDFSFNFTTIGFVMASSFSPANGTKKVELNAKVSVNFNQTVDHSSAESKFNINPNVSGSFAWNNNSLIFNHNDFASSQTYTITVSDGVKSIDGLDSNESFSSSFTTRELTIILNVPSYKQSYKYSCQAAAARMALAYRGISVSEMDIMNKIGFDATSWSGTWGDANATWGDPNQAIVGDLGGNTAPGWGYGVHWGPTARAIANWRPTETKTGWNVQGIAAEIANGNPVLVWWVNGVWPAYKVQWKNNGNTINAVNSLHTQVVKGFTGSVDNPTSLIVTDSGYGYPGRSFDIATFQAKWGWFNNSAVIVK